MGVAAWLSTVEEGRYIPHHPSSTIAAQVPTGTATMTSTSERPWFGTVLSLRSACFVNGAVAVERAQKPEPERRDRRRKEAPQPPIPPSGEPS